MVGRSRRPTSSIRSSACSTSSPAARSFFEVYRGRRRSTSRTAIPPGRHPWHRDRRRRRGEITIRLDEPDGTFSNVLAMDFAGLVPGDTPFKNMSARPGARRRPVRVHEVGAQPRVRAAAASRASSCRACPPRQDRHDHHQDRQEQPTRQAQDVIRGDLDYMQDQIPPGRQARDRAELLRPLPATHGHQLDVLLLPQQPPCRPSTTLKVRQAVNYGDRQDRAGEVVRRQPLAPGGLFLPPGVPGSEPAFDVKDCPWGDPRKPPESGQGAQPDRTRRARRAQRSRSGATQTRRRRR